MAFEIRDFYGDHLTVRPTAINAYVDAPPLPAVGIQVENGVTLYLPANRVEEVVAGIRDTARTAARQTTGQDDTTCSLPGFAGCECNHLTGCEHPAPAVGPYAGGSYLTAEHETLGMITARFGGDSLAWEMANPWISDTAMPLPAGLRVAIPTAAEPEPTPVVGQPAEAHDTDRCASCDHQRTYHDADGQCWFTVDWGRPGSNLVCPCAPRPVTVEGER